MSEFIHLHNHSHYSLLDGLTTPEELIEAAKADGQHAVALTDHGVMFGAVEFYKLAKKYDIKPIIGLEAYITNRSRFDKTPRAKKDKLDRRNYFHILLLAKNERGYKNLLKLTSLGHSEGFYYKPRIDKELLERHHEGLVATSACLGGVISPFLIYGQEEQARKEAMYYKELFGDDFYLEIQNHNLPEDEIILNKMPVLAKELDIKLVATNDIHYLKKDHATAHNVLLMIRGTSAANADKIDVKKLRYRTDEFYFKSQAEMLEIFKDFPDATKNTLEITDKCNFDIELGKLHMPVFPIPEESKSTNLDEYLEELVWKGIENRYKEKTDEIINRTNHELKIITDMGFSGYFLIVQDFIRAAKELGVRVGPGRGSAAGSIIAYALEITNVDPLHYDLLFERFLNPERVSMPDIDIDFADDKRDIIIDYVKKFYGQEAVAQIITFGKLSSKAVITDVCRVLGVDLGTVRKITSQIPVIQGNVLPIEDSLELSELKWLKDSQDQRLQELIDYSLILEGKNRQAGTHAAGVVIAPGDITDYVPIYISSKSKEQSIEVATQYSMNDLEDAGLLKMDFLGLRTLSIIENTLEMIKENYGKYIEIDEIPIDDEKTYEMIGQGNTLAIFQFESGGMQEYLKQLKPKSIEEITAMNALYRPGPMANIPDFIDRKFGRKPIEYLHPIMEKSLSKTYGIIVYQEQVMQLVQEVAGFSLGQADILRRAMGKKKIELMEAQKPKFIKGAAERGISEKQALDIFDLIAKFAKYGFNKSHSVAYSVVAYQTAWLKANYTAEFLAANMTAEINEQAKVVNLIEEARKFDIEVLPPDINTSTEKFVARDNKIFFSLAAIRNVGLNAAKSIVDARQDGNFTSFFDFAARIDPRIINRRTLEGLILAGAFDSLGKGKRAALFAVIEPALDFARACNADGSDTENLFGGDEALKPVEPQIPEVDEWDKSEILKKEKEYLNFYVSGHPFEELIFMSNLFTSIINLSESANRKEQTIMGLIKEIRRRRDKKDRTIAFVILEDDTSSIECIFWGDTYEKFGHILENDKPVVISGRLSTDNDEYKITANNVMEIEEAMKKSANAFKILLKDDKKTNEKLQNFHSNHCNSNGSKTDIHFSVSNGNSKRIFLASGVNIPFDLSTAKLLCSVFGNRNVKVVHS